MMTFITGVTGFIGCRLWQPGDRALVRRPVGLPGEVVGDLLDAATLARACEGVDAVFHCAGMADADAADDALHWRVNFEGTRNLLTAAATAGVRRFVFFSSVKAMAEPGAECADEDLPGEPASAYGRAKRLAENAVLEAGVRFGMHVVILRPVPVYGRGGQGNLMRMAQAVRAGWFPPLPETGNRRSIVHVEDVVAAARLVAERPEANGRTYIVADPRPYSTRELYDAMRAVLRKPNLSWSIPEAWLRAAGRVSRRAELAVERLLGSAWYSPTRIERELGWRARVGLIAGLREMLEVEDEQ
ncbi:NAD-dependent epimerase/dehydratase family protein [Tepidiphilus margaritifer]|uniref:NAD-dependent epimerase/dehydratase family protein n=1 Tax=Tepidiphilus margaritifer TaxID=203471 RepID=UPI000562840C|nr:NAD-dependent epimerase/dehydratase family protein [Tepidiphilus margaritifer]